MKISSLFLPVALSCILLLGGCASPNTTVRTADDRPALAFQDAPKDALLFVDELSMGPANQYNGRPKVLMIEPGMHNVRVTVNSKILFEQRVFVESSTKTIKLH